MPITSLTEAKNAWASLHKKRYATNNRKAKKFRQDLDKTYLLKVAAEQYMSAISEKFVTQSTNQSERFKPTSLNEAAKKIQIRWRHRKEVKFFSNNRTVHNSVNKKLAADLLLAIQQCDWEADIFTDFKLPYVALSLFTENKISYYQIATTLERFYVFKEFSHRKTYTILDLQGNFTPEAKAILFPAITRPNLPLNAKQKEAFRLLILALPPSEQIFYTTEAGCLKFNHSTDQLGNTLHELGALYIHNYKEAENKTIDAANMLQKNDESEQTLQNEVIEDELPHIEIVRLSMGAFDALGIARFEDNYVRPIFRLGIQTIDDVISGVRNLSRLASIPYPQWPFYSSIHGLKPITVLEAIDHDRFHSLQMSKMPKSIIYALWNMSDNFTKQTKISMSKEIWSWHDAEFNYVYDSAETVNALTYKNNPEFSDSSEISDLTEMVDIEREPYYYLSEFNLENLSIKDNTDLFCRMLSAGQDGMSLTSGGFLFIDNEHITPAGILTFISMIEQPENWEACKIAPKYLLPRQKGIMAPFEESYQSILSIYNAIKKDRPELQVFKCFLYFHLEKQNKVNQFNELCQYIDNYPDVVSSLQFEKITNKAEWTSNLQELLPSNVGKFNLSKICNLTVLTNMASLVCPSYLKRFILAKTIKTSMPPTLNNSYSYSNK